MLTSAVRDYRADSDRAFCLDIFDSNVPDFFVPPERVAFEAFLDDLPGPYFVCEPAGRIVACGGYAMAEGGRRADLCWGMVHRRMHRQGLGQTLARYRIDRALRHPGLSEIALQTSQHTSDFYGSLGFEVVDIEPDGFGEGMDRLDMRLRVERAVHGRKGARP